MAEQGTITDSHSLVTNTPMYAVKMGNRHFHSFKKGIPQTVGYAVYFTSEQATAICKKIQEDDYEPAFIKAAHAKENSFWINERGYYSEYTLEQLSKPCWLFESTPLWFINAMKKVAPESDWWGLSDSYEGLNNGWGGDSEAAIMVFREHFETDGWMDHAGWVEECGQTVFVSEPYAIKNEALVNLMNFANKCNFVVRISGVSHHYPGRTLRIEIAPSEPSMGA